VGWLYLLWRLCRPPEADPPGLGMAWQDAKRLNATIAKFLLSNEDRAKALSLRARHRYLRAGGQLGTVGDAKKQAKEYMDALRKHYTDPGAE